MSRPLLQLALDHTSLQAAQRDVALLQDHVDIVEAGTILCLTEGLNAVSAEDHRRRLESRRRR